MRTAIERVVARQVLDSRAHPTVEVDVHLACGAVGRGIVPSGTSTGRFEAVELRDGDPRSFGGRSVRKAIAHVQDLIAPRVRGMDALDQAALDRALVDLDGTPSRSRLGANAVLGVSMAAAWAAANATGVPLYRHLGGPDARTLPVPMVQIIGGGLHAGRAIDVQDFLVVPLAATSCSQAIEMAVNVYHATADVFRAHGKPVSVADEGGFWPTFSADAEGLDLLVEGIARAGYAPGEDVAIALDVASSHFFDDGAYRFAAEGRARDSADLAELLASWVERYPILSIEDGMAEDDWAGWARLTALLGRKVQLVGDDLFTTNAARIERGIALGVANAVLVKMNQIGTLTEAIEAVRLAQRAGYLPIVSARSGETEDATIAHLAVATNAGQLKVGSVARSERTAKWNELVRIEEALGDAAVYPGARLFERFRRR
jgi:enolase